MSNAAGCALNANGTLKDASEIEWFHDRDDNTPAQRRSGRATKPSAKVREANDRNTTSVTAPLATTSKRGVSLLSDDEDAQCDKGGPQKSMYSSF